MRPASSPSAAGMASNAAQPGSAAPSSADAYSDAQLARLRDLHQRRARGELGCEFITICGFPTAGKTWLTPRLKSDLIARRGWSYEADEREHAQTEREILAGIKSMGQTEDLLIHSLTPGRGLAGTSIKLIDIPGEYLRRLAEPGEDADLPLALLVALAISDRIILTLPSDVCVIGSLIHRAIAAETDPRRKKARSAEVLDRDTNRLAVDRQELAERLRDMRDAEQEQSTDYATAFATFKDVSIQLSQTLLAEQWTKLSRFATRIRRVIGRAAYLGHTVGRDKIFDLPPESWISATANLEDRDTLVIHIHLNRPITSLPIGAGPFVTHVGQPGIKLRDQFRHDRGEQQARIANMRGELIAPARIRQRGSIFGTLGQIIPLGAGVQAIVALGQQRQHPIGLGQNRIGPLGQRNCVSIFKASGG